MRHVQQFGSSQFTLSRPTTLHRIPLWETSGPKYVAKPADGVWWVRGQPSAQPHPCVRSRLVAVASLFVICHIGPKLFFLVNVVA
jgi:hypothetical protein